MSALGWPLILLGIAMVSLVAEAFLPSGGALLVVAVTCLGLSLWLAFQDSFELGVEFLLADTLITPLTVALALYLWQKSPLAAKMTLRPPVAEEIAVSHAGRRIDHLIGSRGRTLTPLHPTGVVDFDGRRLEGISEAGLIPEGVSIQAVDVRSGRLIVRPLVPPTTDF